MPSNLLASGARSFRGRLKKRIEKQQDMRIRVLQKRIIFSLYEGVVKLTPVDTGRAAGNYIIGIGAPDRNRSLLRFNKPRATKIGEFTKLRRLKLGQKVYINNNLTYIQALERGRSKDSSFGGMVRTSIFQTTILFRTKKVRLRTTTRMQPYVC